MPTLGDTLDLTETLAPVRECVEVWDAEHERLEADLNESLQALEAYQRSLDAWQAQLVEDRERLAGERAEWEADRTSAGEEDAQNARRVAELEQQLADAAAREEQLEASLAAKREELAEQQLRWDDDFRHMRELIDQQAELATAAAKGPAPEESAAMGALDSVLEQFGQLRKQQADRRASGAAESQANP